MDCRVKPGNDENAYDPHPDRSRDPASPFSRGGNGLTIAGCRLFEPLSLLGGEKTQIVSLPAFAAA
jgi:hypothetical protein